MNSRALRRVSLLAGVATTSALVLAGCAGGATPGETTEPGGEDITLTLATFNDFGYTDELLAEFTAETGIKVVHNRAAESADARSNFFQKLGSGGLADVEAVEIDWFPEMIQYADLLVPAGDDVKGRWLDWKEGAATIDGKLVAYGTDIGPQGICYRSDLFEAAGLPSDRDGAGALFGTWDDFFKVGADYTAATGKPFVDSANSILQGMANQVEFTYEDADGAIIADSNPEVKRLFETTVDKAVPISAFGGQWSDDWFASMSNGEFATMLCPGWMLGIISGNAPDITGWDIANAFPGGGGNWGGSYLAVPAKGSNTEAASQLASWLTSPETQLKAFANVGAFPSQVEALSSPDLLNATNEYFNNAPVGQILTERAEAVTVTPFKGAQYFQYHTALQDAVVRVFDGQETKDAAWQSFLAEIAAF